MRPLALLSLLLCAAPSRAADPLDWSLVESRLLAAEDRAVRAEAEAKAARRDVADLRALLDAREQAPAKAAVPAAPCCSAACTCGCQAGQPCRCGGPVAPLACADGACFPATATRYAPAAQPVYGVPLTYSATPYDAALAGGSCAGGACAAGGCANGSCSATRGVPAVGVFGRRR